MWALVESGSVSKIFTTPKQLRIGDINYPSNIFTLWSSSELQGLGLYSVVIDKTNYKDKEYYTNTDITYSFSDNTVTGSYGTAVAKSIDNILYTSEDVAADVYEEGHSQAGQRVHTWVAGDVKNYGLKHIRKDKINSEAASLLQSTDWMTIRETEGGTAMPSNIKTWRASVRTKANDMCTQIDNAADVDALAALYVYNNATPPVRPLGEFPELG